MLADGWARLRERTEAAEDRANTTTVAGGRKGPRTPPTWLRPLLLRVLPWLYRHGAGTWMCGRGLILVTTVGRRSGLRRTVPLAGFRDGDAWVVGAGNYGGEAEPRWFLNVLEHPADVWIEAGNQRVRVAAQVLPGEERQVWLRRVPVMRAYQNVMRREFAMVRLAPAVADNEA